MNDKTRQHFASWFNQATGYEPYPFQIRFACEPKLPELVDVPTGLGKTAMAVLGWLWLRNHGGFDLSGSNTVQIDRNLG